jgi:Solute carrier family 35
MTTKERRDENGLASPPTAATAATAACVIEPAAAAATTSWLTVVGFGQLLSFLLASGGAVQAVLSNNCHLIIPPTFTILFFYVGLVLTSFVPLVRHYHRTCCGIQRGRRPRHHYLRVQEDGSYSQDEEDENGMELTEAATASAHSNTSLRFRRALPELEVTSPRHLPAGSPPVSPALTVRSIRSFSPAVPPRPIRSPLVPRSRSSDAAVPATDRPSQRSWSEGPADVLEESPTSESESALPAVPEHIEEYPYRFGFFNPFQKNVDAPNSATASSPTPYLNYAIPLHHSPYRYFVMALLDVYANYFTVLSFRYTTLTSVTLLDALAIPSALLLSFCCLHKQYSVRHLLGVLLCLTGVLTNVWQDYRDENSQNYAEPLLNPYPHKMKGDVFAVLGGVLFGAANVLTESTVQSSTSTAPGRQRVVVNEYLGMMGLFAMVRVQACGDDGDQEYTAISHAGLFVIHNL